MKNCNNGTPIEAVRRAASAAFQDQRECNGQRNGPARLLAQTGIKVVDGDSGHVILPGLSRALELILSNSIVLNTFQIKTTPCHMVLSSGYPTDFIVVVQVSKAT